METPADRWNRLHNIKGHRFGSLVVGEYAGIRNGKSVWHCSCDCGGKTITSADNLRSGNTKGCGCAPRPLSISENDVFGKLTARHVVVDSDGRRRKWMCECECGEMKVIFTTSLNSGRSRSCGCSMKSSTRQDRRIAGLKSLASKGRADLAHKAIDNAAESDELDPDVQMAEDLGL